MASIDAATIGRRIAEARGRSGLTQAELAASVPIDRSGLAKIEAGTRRVSALELARIAEALGERIEWFVDDAPPAIVSRRNVQEPGAPSPMIDSLVERVVRNVEFAAAQDQNLLKATPRMLERPQSVRDADKAAKSARSLLGLDASEPALELSRRAAGAGLLLFSVDLGQEAADAASVLLPVGGVAVVNGYLRVGRRRLAAAHELGHHLFADEYTVDWRIAEQGDSDKWESLIDRFARAVLLPGAGLADRWQGLRAGGDDLRTSAVRLASAFRVDMSTLARRLLELDLVSRAEADHIRLVRTTKADIVEFGLVIQDELAPSELSRPYVEAVLRLYRNGTVSAARATDMLLDTWDEADLPQVPLIPENSIWKFVS